MADAFEMTTSTARATDPGSCGERSPPLPKNYRNLLNCLLRCGVFREGLGTFRGLALMGGSTGPDGVQPVLKLVSIIGVWWSHQKVILPIANDMCAETSQNQCVRMRRSFTIV